MTTPINQFPYLRDILGQPQAVADTLDGLRQQSLPAAVVDGLRQGTFRRVVLTGMGSSYFMFHPLHQALVRRGVEAQMVETSELLYALDGLLRSDTLVIAASQSGASAETVSLLKRRDAGFTLLGVSNTNDSPLAREAAGCILTRAGDEETVSCKTYLAGLMALAWLEPVLFGEPMQPVLADLECLSPAVADYLAGWQDHVADLQARLAQTREVFFTGRGASLASAGTAGLILKESTHLHGEGMSSAAFRHGPLEMVSPEIFALIFEGQGHAAVLNRHLYQDILSAGGAAGLVSESAKEPVFRLPPVPASLRPVVEILPAQMMTLALAANRGHVAGQFSHASKVTTKE